MNNVCFLFGHNFDVELSESYFEELVAGWGALGDFKFESFDQYPTMFLEYKYNKEIRFVGENFFLYFGKHLLVVSLPFRWHSFHFNQDSLPEVLCEVERFREVFDFNSCLFFPMSSQYYDFAEEDVSYESLLSSIDNTENFISVNSEVDFESLCYEQLKLIFYNCQID